MSESSGGFLSDNLVQAGVRYELNSSSVRLRGNVELKKPIDLLFSCYDRSSEREDFDRGKIHISSPDVNISGLQIDGGILIDDNLHNLHFRNCRIRGFIRIGSSCLNIRISCCEIEGSRSFGILVGSYSQVCVDRTTFKTNMVGLSLSHEVPMVTEIIMPEAREPYCCLNSCTFESNTTDVVVQVRIVSGEEGANKALINAKSILSISGEESDAVKYDVSISGRLDAPFSFKEWPIPINKFQGLSVGRRGVRSNKRMCHFVVDKDGKILMTEDSPKDDIQGGDRPKNKRSKKSSSEFSKAEIHYCQVLGIDPGKTKSAISAAYKKLALLHHPDKEGGETHTFIEVKKARDELMKIVEARQV